MAPRGSQKRQNDLPQLTAVYDNGQFKLDHADDTYEKHWGAATKEKGQQESTINTTAELRPPLPTITKKKPGSSLRSYPSGVYFCMLNELFERFAYYAILVILTFYLRSRYDMSDSTAKLIFHGFVCLCFLTPIIGSVWSDGFSGPFRVVIYLLVAYCLGMAMLTAGSMTLDEKDGVVDQILKIVGVIGLLLVSLASGGRKPCVPAFAADQFPENMQKERQQFFSYFYMAMNVGTLFSQSLTPTLRGGIGCMGEDTCYPVAFSVAAGAIVVATLIFVAGSHCYKKEHRRDNMIGRVCSCILHALSEMFKRCWFKRDGEKVHIEKQPPHSHWLDHSVQKFGRPMVDDVRRVLNICLLFVPAITFWALYDQMFSTWLIQTDAMNGRTGQGVTILPDQLAMLFSVMILLVIPLLDKVVYPLCNKCNFLNTPLQKLGLGGFLAAASFLLAGGLQVKVNQTIYDAIQPGYTRHVIYNAATNSSDSAECSLDAIFRPIRNQSGDDVIISQSSTADAVDHVFQLSIPHSKSDVESVQPYIYEYLLNCTGGSAQNNSQDLNTLYQHRLLDRLVVFWPHRSGFKQHQQQAPFDMMYFPKVKPINGYSRVYPLIDPDWIKSHQQQQNSSLTLIFSQNDDVIKEFLLVGHQPMGEFLDIKLPVLGSNIFQLYLKIDNEKIFYGQYTSDSGAVDAIVISAANQNSSSLSAASNFSTNHNSTTSASIVNLIPANQIHLIWQVPQYFLMAVGEATFGIAGMEFAYSQASPSMKSVMQAIWLLTCMVGNLIAMLISGLHLVENPATEFFVYALLMLLFMVSFMSTSRKYEYVDQQSRRDATNVQQDSTKIQQDSTKVQQDWKIYDAADFHYNTRL